MLSDIAQSVPRADGARPAAGAVAWWRDSANIRAAATGALVMLILWLGSVVLFAQSTVYHSADETSNRTFTEAFGTTGKLWYEDDLLALDDENLLHPRGVLTHEGRAVPFNYLGVPLVYGALYPAIGDDVRFIGLLLAGASLFFLYRAAHELFRARALETLAAVAGCTPLIYYFNLPYMNALPAITMFCGGIWCLARYHRRAQTADVALASLFFAGSMLFRYEYAIFEGPLIALALYHRAGALRSRAFARNIAIFVAIVAAVFLAPVLIMNQVVYGNWQTYGYSLFNDVYFPDRSAQEGLSALENGLRSVRGIFLPSYPLSLVLVVHNLARFMLLLAPALTLCAAGGLWLAIRRQVLPRKMFILFGVLALYVLVYRGSSGNLWQGTDGLQPTFNASVVRYWLPVYVVMSLLAAYAIHNVQRPALRAAAMALVAGVGAITLLGGVDGGVLDLRAEVRAQEEWTSTEVLRRTPKDAVVFAGRSDKSIVPYRTTAAWWNAEELYDTGAVARSISRVYATGRPVYVVREREVDLSALNAALAPYGLRTTSGPRGTLVQVRPAPMPLTYPVAP